MGERSAFTYHTPWQDGFGKSRSWTREIAGKLYTFTEVFMPSGERRYAASQLREGGDPRFACDWNEVLFWQFHP